MDLYPGAYRLDKFASVYTFYVQETQVNVKEFLLSAIHAPS